MASDLRQLEIMQFGRETTPGTPVLQTYRWVGQGMVTPEEPKNWSRSQSGTLFPRSQRGTIVQRSARVRLEGDLTFEQPLYIWNMGLAGLTSPTGAGADRTWQFTPSFTAPTFNFFTLGYRKSDGTSGGAPASPWDERISYLMCESWEISANVGENAKISAECIGRPVELTTSTEFTTGVAVPTVNYVPSSLFKLYINDTFGTIGTTQKTCTIVSFRLTYRSPWQAKYYLDGRTDLSFCGHGLKDADYELEIVAEFTTDMRSEQLKADDNPGALRYIRLEAVGATLGASNYEIEIDGAFEYEQGGFDVDSDRDGNGTCTLRLLGSLDTTNSLGLKAKSINAMTTLI
jgi:hypothetical protein